MTEIRDKFYKNSFKERVLLKVNSDLKSLFFKHHAAKVLDETFDEMLNDESFLRWLTKQLDYKAYIPTQEHLKQL